MYFWSRQSVSMHAVRLLHSEVLRARTSTTLQSAFTCLLRRIDTKVSVVQRTLQRGQIYVTHPIAWYSHTGNVSPRGDHGAFCTKSEKKHAPDSYDHFPCKRRHV